MFVAVGSNSPINSNINNQNNPNPSNFDKFSRKKNKKNKNKKQLNQQIKEEYDNYLESKTVENDISQTPFNNSVIDLVEYYF